MSTNNDGNVGRQLKSSPTREEEEKKTNPRRIYSTIHLSSTERTQKNQFHLYAMPLLLACTRKLSKPQLEIIRFFQVELLLNPSTHKVKKHHNQQ